MTKLIIGCGYVGWRVARRWHASGSETMAITRSPDKAQQLAKEGIQPLLLDVGKSLQLPKQPLFETVLFSLGSEKVTKTTYQQWLTNTLNRVLDNLSQDVKRFLYISSTGVYGQRNGEWVDEDSPCNPRRNGGQACLEAERTLLAHRWADRAIVLRLAGIYGPERTPHLEGILRGQPILVSEERLLNLIHVDDAVEAIVTAERNATPPCVYNVSDGHPVLRRDFYREAARLLGVPRLQFARPTPTSSTTQRAESNKRVSNALLLRDFCISHKYSSYREGLAAIVRDWNPSW